jgi:hypothetical protein
MLLEEDVYRELPIWMVPKPQVLLQAMYGVLE